MAPGVSSTISSTPVATSSARMLRPSRPMIRPFMSSLGRSTTVTVVSIVCSAALRWMACVMMARARSAACSRASVSSRLTSAAASCRASASSCLSSSSRASSAVRPATRSQLLLLLRAERLGSRGCGGHGRSSRAASAVLAAGEVLVRARRAPAVARWRRVALGQQLFHARDLLALVADELLGLEPQLVRALARLDHRFLAARLGVALGVAQDPARLLLGRGPRSRPRCACGWRPSRRTRRRRRRRRRGSRGCT